MIVLFDLKAKLDRRQKKAEYELLKAQRELTQIQIERLDVEEIEYNRKLYGQDAKPEQDEIEKMRELYDK